MMWCTRLYVDPTQAMMVQARKKSSQTSKEVMRDHEGSQFIIYRYRYKGEKSIICREILLYLSGTYQHLISS